MEGRINYDTLKKRPTVERHNHSLHRRTRRGGWLTYAISILVISILIITAMTNSMIRNEAPTPVTKASNPVIDYTCSIVSYNWIEISVTGNMFDNPLPLGFNFQFYENVYNEIYVAGSFGFAVFTIATRNLQQNTFPSEDDPDNLVSLLGWMTYWLEYAWVQSGVFFERDGSSPNKRITIEFYSPNEVILADPPAPTLGDSVTFELILYESGHILFQYKDINGLQRKPNAVGIENIDGSNNVLTNSNIRTRYSHSYFYDGDSCFILRLEKETIRLFLLWIMAYLDMA